MIKPFQSEIECRFEPFDKYPETPSKRPIGSSTGLTPTALGTQINKSDEAQSRLDLSSPEPTTSAQSTSQEKSAVASSSSPSTALNAPQPAQAQTIVAPPAILQRSKDERKFSAIVQGTSSLFYLAFQIPLLIDIGATAFREGDMDNATRIVVSRASILPRQQQVERRAREPPDKSDTLSSESWPPNWQLNITVSPSVPMRATSAASGAATSTEITLPLSSPNGRTPSKGAERASSKHHSIALAKLQVQLFLRIKCIIAFIPGNNFPREKLVG